MGTAAGEPVNLIGKQRHRHSARFSWMLFLGKHFGPIPSRLPVFGGDIKHGWFARNVVQAQHPSVINDGAQDREDTIISVQNGLPCRGTKRRMTLPRRQQGAVAREDLRAQ